MKSPGSLRLLSALLLPVLAVPLAFGWGSDGHTIINRLGAQSLPADMPAFLRTPEAVNEIAYLGPEPDRWRSRAEPELASEQAPDHFIDIELANKIGPLPRGRYEYIGDLYAYIASHPAEAQAMRPERVGFQPYIVEEVWERLKSAMRDYRQLSAQQQDTKPVEAAILFYAGWLGHYVADGSQPLHVTVNYNGWVGKDNPNGYTTEHTIHSQFETAFVAANITLADVQPLVAPVHPIGDEWDDYLAYLRHSSSLVERVYQLDKTHGFDGAGTPEAKQFTEERLAAGASMLRDLIVAAWVKSADPVPAWHPAGAAKGGTGAAGGMSARKIDADFAEQSGNGPLQPGKDGVSAPVLRSSKSPKYTKEARKKKIQGIVVVSLVVDAEGLPHDVRVTRPLGYGLDEEAVAAVNRYRFTPAMLNGKPVPVQVNIEVNYRIY